MSDASKNRPLLEMRGIHKRFPGVVALNDVSLSLRKGEVLALLGENGAGKSTLIKMLGGAHQPDEGTITLEGETVEITSAVEAREKGIAVIYQEFNLVPQLTVAENIFLGRERVKWGKIDHEEERSEAVKVLEKIGMSLDPQTRCSELTIAQQQVVEIAKALSTDAKILIMDEPSAVLTERELKKLFTIVEDLRRQGIGIIYISHRLEEVFEIADRLSVLRDGELVGERAVSETDRESLIEMMVGRSLESEFPAREVRIGEVALKVENLSRAPVVNGVSFSVRKGEILGVSGLVGAGRTETLRLIFGVDRPDGGKISVHGEWVQIRSPREAIASGMCLLSEDRKGEGLVVQHPVIENFGLPNLRRYSNGLFLSEPAEAASFDRYRESIRIKCASNTQKAGELSGGNQQKVVLAKWLERNADIILIDEPTRGIDVGAKLEIYELMNRLAAEGKAIIMVSSELPEILGMSDRVLVMSEGKITGEISDVKNACQEDLLALAMPADTRPAS